ncbi:IgGFc-binding protein [Nannocystis radixulma]|uniref:IgGFc-binding protein n=1 Tax=Nannocystis radixulma TaxID=2995305 RepID=A0ABT5B2N2_9BACT|nr:IgGFc-binding protein [Nannocystis radixulma]MDC0667930.1 IgGFc-binding protein [Nannocystis radixulma]
MLDVRAPRPVLRVAPALALNLAACGGGGSDDTASSTSITVPMTSEVTATASTEPTPTGGTTEPTPTGGTTELSTSASTTDSTPKLDVGGVPDVPPSLQCSADLHAVVDGLGQVVEACAADQGCADGVCIAACQAAAASKANFGCEFHVPTPPTQIAIPPCFAAFVTNTWGHPAQFEVSRDGVDFDLAVFARVVTPGQTPEQWPPVPAEGLAPGEVAVLFLSGDPDAVHPQTNLPLNCPVTTAVTAGTELKTSGRGTTFAITSDIPLTAYDIAPFGGAFSYVPSAELLFPSSAYGTNYVAIVPPAGTHDVPGPLWLQIVGLVDGTSVDIRPTVDLEAGPGLDGAPAGQTTQFTVAAGEYLQWHLAAGGDGSGTLILADQPIAVHTGNRFLRLQPMPSPGGESTHQQNNPVATLGREYVAAPYETRRADLVPEQVDYRIVGAVDGTELSYDPAIPGAPTTLAQGEVVDFATDQPFRVRSQDEMHPFVFAQLMDTCHLPGGTREGATAAIQGFETLLGDEEFVLVLPPAQYLQKYVFFTDPSFSTTNLALTRVDAGDGFKDVTVDCLGTITGWQPVGTDGVYEVATVDLVRANESDKGCTNGGHAAESEGPFGLVVWGLDNHSSYAYPAGGNAKPLTDLVIPPN